MLGRIKLLCAVLVSAVHMVFITQLPFELALRNGPRSRHRRQHGALWSALFTTFSRGAGSSRTRKEAFG